MAGGGPCPGRGQHSQFGSRREEGLDRSQIINVDVTSGLGANEISGRRENRTRVTNAVDGDVRSASIVQIAADSAHLYLDLKVRDGGRQRREFPWKPSGTCIACTVLEAL